MLFATEDHTKWERVQTRLRASVGEATFSAWLQSIRPETLIGTTVHCTVATNFLKRWLSEHYRSKVLSCMQTEWHEITQVQFHLRGNAPQLQSLLLYEEAQEELVTQTTSSESSVADDPQEDVFEETLPSEAVPPPPRPAGQRIYIEDVIRGTGRFYKLTQKDILSDKRPRAIVRPRQIGMFLAKYMTARSLPEIGRRFGGRDHTTVLHSVRKVEMLVREDIEIAFEVASLEASIRQRVIA